MEQFFLKMPKWAITALSCCVSGFIAALALVCLGLTWGIFRGDLIETPYFKVSPQQFQKLNNSANQLNSSIKELELSQQHINELYAGFNLDKSSWKQFITGVTANSQGILNWKNKSQEIQQLLSRQQQLLEEQQTELEIFNKTLNEIK
ncbi:TPA: hypothetical protein ACXV19_002003 [Legionella anisa]